VPAGVACPVTGRPIDKAVSIDYQGAKLYFSAPDCIAKYQAEPARYTVGANYQLAVTGQARQVACPFTGKALNPNVAAVKVGVLDVGFCCRACQQTVANADLQTQYTLVFGDAFATGYKIVKK
jgi:YHS domain-containing protein